MQEAQLKTLKEVAAQLDQPAHRIIHLCESGVVKPEVGADGRGSVRRFSGDDVFCLHLALELQDAGIQVPLIKPLIRALRHLKDSPELPNAVARIEECFDLQSIVSALGTPRKPMRAYLAQGDPVVLVAPSVKKIPALPSSMKLLSDEDQVRWGPVTIVVNLTLIAEKR